MKQGIIYVGFIFRVFAVFEQHFTHALIRERKDVIWLVELERDSKISTL